jgi:hypothetical protein
MKRAQTAETIPSTQDKGGRTLEIEIRKDLGFAEVWLTNDDQKNEELLAWLQEQYPRWRAQKLMPVIFRSGKEDLYENTLALLKYNRRRSAELELAREKEQGMTMSM